MFWSMHPSAFFKCFISLEPMQNFELNPLFNPQSYIIPIPLTITGGTSVKLL